MSTYKRGGVYWYKFMFNGSLIRESTKQGNDKVARKIEAAHRTRLAEGMVGIREKKPSPSLMQFINERIEPWAKGRQKWPWFFFRRAALTRVQSHCHSEAGQHHQ